jgi:hypothetical protein
LESLGFATLPEEVLRMKLPQLHMNLASDDGASATVYNALFHDQYGGYEGTALLPS